MADTDPPREVLFLFTDQERYDLTSRDGLPVETPAIDRIRDEGVRFTRAFTPISICSSARASLLTGLYPHDHGVVNNVHDPDAIRENLPTSLPTFGSLLADAGYDNTYVGKWHVGRDARPEDFGFDYIDGSDRHHDSNLESGFEAYREELGIDPDGVELEDTIYAEYPDDRHLIAGRTPVDPEATRPYYIAECTIERLEAVADQAEPFFHRTDFLGPHHPYVVPEPYASMYDPADLEPWPTYAETFDGKPQVQENYLAYRGVDGFDWEDWAQIVSQYMGFMRLIDDQIGRILDAVEELGLSEDLLVVHGSDHGDFAGNHRQFNKGPFMYEDTYRIPMTACGRGVEGSGREIDAKVSLLDLMPTFLEAAGVDVPEGIAGESLWPLLAGRTDEHREAVFAEYHGDELGLYTQRMVRTDRYKYVFNAPDVDELYDLADDPHELRNLIDHPHYEEVRERMRGRLAGWMTETGDPISEWVVRHLVR